ncbi:MAG: DUF1854 domain-containing protein [Verrucomicrobia bacterium]|nr:DUF1854 domain-containing protein [Verrucomicrobiota bacterium]
MTQIRPGKRRDTDTDLATLKLERRADGQLWLCRNAESDPWYAAAVEKAKPADNKGATRDRGDGDAVAVRVAPCFPWSQAGQYISLRTTDDKEVALIGHLDELADDTRRLVEQALAEVGFVLEVTRVESVRTEIEIRNWQVETRQGPCTFQTKLDDWPHPLGDGTFVLRDVAGNLFLIPKPATLDARSNKLLWPFIG